MECLWEDSEYICHRFTCDCMMHLLEVSVEKPCEGEPFITISVDTIADSNEEHKFWERVKVAVAILFRRQRCVWGFVVQARDIPDLLNTLSVAVTNPNTE